MVLRKDGWKKVYCFEIYQPVCVLSSTFSVVFFVSRLKKIVARTERMNALKEKWDRICAKSMPKVLMLK
jgi:hypothetical protein